MRNLEVEDASIYLDHSLSFADLCINCTVASIIIVQIVEGPFGGLRRVAVVLPTKMQRDGGMH